MITGVEIITDAVRWSDLLRTTFNSMQDVYFDTALLETYAKQYGARYEAAFFEDDSIIIFYPYLVRDIKKTPLFSKLSGDLFDITTPYGYGGPLVVVKQQEKLTQSLTTFRDKFERYAHQQNFVTEFVRFHPILENHQYFENALEIVQLSPVATADLTLQPDVLFTRFGTDKQRGIRKAEHAGVQIELVHTITRPLIQEFLQIYRETMDKNTAEKKYYFTESHIQELCVALGKKLFLARAVFGDVCIASYLVFQSGGYLTNYLSGHRRAYQQYYPKNKVIWELEKYGHAQGFRFYNLGGGRPRLLSFKAGFSTELKPFYIGKKIYKKEIYDMLIDMASLNDDEKKFFPAYRHSRIYSELM